MYPPMLRSGGRGQGSPSQQDVDRSGRRSVVEDKDKEGVFLACEVPGLCSSQYNKLNEISSMTGWPCMIG